MSNRKELQRARRKEAEAIYVREQIEALPRRVGSMIQWGEKGLIWRRVGDDRWESLHESGGFEPTPEFGTSPSSHIAASWQGWHQIKKLPTKDAT